MTICDIRRVPDGPVHPDEHLVLPVPARTVDAVVLHPSDGRAIKRLYASQVDLRPVGGAKPFIKAPAVRAEIAITDVRVTIACSRYDKGGGWWGGWASIFLNAGSRLLAAGRRHGTMLVGQVRYPWLAGVYAQNDTRTRHEKLRLIVPADGARLQLDLILPKDVDATRVATEIVHRAARFRLMTGAAPEHQACLEELAVAPRVADRPGSTEMAGFQIPGAQPVGVASGRLGVTAAVVA